MAQRATQRMAEPAQYPQSITSRLAAIAGYDHLQPAISPAVAGITPDATRMGGVASHLVAVVMNRLAEEQAFWIEHHNPAILQMKDALSIGLEPGRNVWIIHGGCGANGAHFSHGVHNEADGHILQSDHQQAAARGERLRWLAQESAQIHDRNDGAPDLHHPHHPRS